MKSLLKKNKLTLIGIGIGIIGGYLYYYFIGCHSGSCAITSSPVNSMIYGAVMGGLLFNTLQDYLQKKEIKSAKTESTKTENQN
ncbi:MAG: hypothetical protein IPH24_13760 [Crocinitomicaceae bacterium]|nr:hypothetical protein [Crocinitomicaceae bacterium]